jgi:hypothetical protein
MGEQMRRTEINALISRVIGLPDIVKFEVFDALREDLAAKFSEEQVDNRKALERKEALLFIKRAAEHLDLPAGKAPTLEQFNAVSRELDWEWNGARIVRLWERWRLAQAAYRGTRKTETKASRSRRQKSRGTRKYGDAEQRYLNSLRLWLASDPEDLGRASYEAFAEQHNLTLGEGRTPMVAVNTLRRGLPVSWALMIRVAKDELTMQKAIDAELAEKIPAKKKYALVGIALIARVLNVAEAKAKELTDNDKNFPQPVAHIRGHRAWLYEDVKLYKRELATPKREEDELQRLFMDAAELQGLLKINRRNFSTAMRNRNWTRIPQPEGSVATSYYYWMREKVQDWLKQKADQTSAV